MAWARLCHSHSCVGKHVPLFPSSLNLLHTFGYGMSPSQNDGSIRGHWIRAYPRGNPWQIERIAFWFGGVNPSCLPHELLMILDLTVPVLHVITTTKSRLPDHEENLDLSNYVVFIADVEMNDVPNVLAAMCLKKSSKGCNPVELVQIHFGPPARNGDENGRRVEFRLAQERGKNGPKNGKKWPEIPFWAIFGPFVPFFVSTFPPFPGRGETPVFGHFVPVPEMDLYQVHGIAKQESHMVHLHNQLLSMECQDFVESIFIWETISCPCHRMKTKHRRFIQERGSGGAQRTGVSQSVRATSRDKPQSVHSPEKLLKKRDLELPFCEGSLPSCSPHSADTLVPFHTLYHLSQNHYIALP